jgi:hypothetical protein
MADSAIVVHVHEFKAPGDVIAEYQRKAIVGLCIQGYDIKIGDLVAIVDEHNAENQVVLDAVGWICRNPDVLRFAVIGRGE